MNENERKLDVRPWAAYIVGHHPYSLRRRYADLRESKLLVKPSARLERKGIAVEIQELNAALRELALDGQTDPQASLEFHRAKDEYVAFCQQVTKPTQMRYDASESPGDSEWRYMVAFSKKVVATTEELQLWRELGTAMGKCIFYLSARPEESEGEFVPSTVEDLLEPAMRLSRNARNLFLREVIIAAEEVAESMKPKSRQTPLSKISDRVLAELDDNFQPTIVKDYLSKLIDNHQYMMLIDARLRAVLRQYKMAAPILILDKDSIVLFKIRKKLHELRDCEKELRCLWVLASHPNKLVERKLLRREAGISTPSVHLAPIISRLRSKVLRPLAKQYALYTGCRLPKGYSEGFFEGKRAIGNNGPYRLLFDDTEVLVKLPKPDWMRLPAEE
jgi:hypothetical protein